MTEAKYIALVHGSTMFKTHLFQTFNWISAIRFEELIQFGQIQNLGGEELSE